MSRLKLQLPEAIHYTTELAVRISDINYGNHLSNQVYLSYMHEARVQFFKHFGFSEMDIAGVSVIMGDSAIVFKKECFYGDELRVEVSVADFGPRSFDFYYRFIRIADEQLVCEAKTGMVCFNYNERKTAEVPQSFRQLFEVNSPQKIVDK